jgi:hypothetical protein
MNGEDFPAPREGVLITHFLVVRAWGTVSNPADRPGSGDPLLHPRPRRPPHRGRAGYRHLRGLRRRGLDTASDRDNNQATFSFQSMW